MHLRDLNHDVFLADLRHFNDLFHDIVLGCAHELVQLVGISIAPCVSHLASHARSVNDIAGAHALNHNTRGAARNLRSCTGGGMGTRAKYRSTLHERLPGCTSHYQRTSCWRNCTGRSCLTNGLPDYLRSWLRKHWRCGGVNCVSVGFDDIISLGKRSLNFISRDRHFGQPSQGVTLSAPHYKPTEVCLDSKRTISGTAAVHHSLEPSCWKP
mmetsp:Transcript_66851/g.160017  ORF Transcript_66851/g.160017 Transcript_66851/m.160017 type:complete len:212 (-) Transcript_66851:11-646(-)